MALLRVKRVTKSFHGNKAVDDVTFEVRAGRSSRCSARTARVSPP